MAFAIASMSSSTVRGILLRKIVFSLDHASSIGLRSGEYGGMKRIRVPRASTSARTPSRL